MQTVFLIHGAWLYLSLMRSRQKGICNWICCLGSLYDKYKFLHSFSKYANHKYILFYLYSFQFAWMGLLSSMSRYFIFMKTLNRSLKIILRPRGLNDEWVMKIRICVGMLEKRSRLNQMFLYQYYIYDTYSRYMISYFEPLQS